MRSGHYYSSTFGLLGHDIMSDNAKQTLFRAGQDSGAPERDSATPALKTWVTPKVITSTTASDAASGSAAISDGHGSAQS